MTIENKIATLSHEMIKRHIIISRQSRVKNTRITRQGVERHIISFKSSKNSPVLLIKFYQYIATRFFLNINNM